MKKLISEMKQNEVMYDWTHVVNNGKGSEYAFTTVEEAIEDAKKWFKGIAITRYDFNRDQNEDAFVGISKITVDEEGIREELEDDFVETFEITEETYGKVC